jgi:DNA polymerase-4
MSIACVIVPYFVAAVERRDDPSLTSIPLVIGDFRRERGEVYAFSREAAGMGVKRGIPLRQAETLCPEAAFIPLSEMRYSRAFQELLEILEEFTQLVEPDGLGCAYLDIGGLERGQATEVVQYMGQAVREGVHLSAAIGLAEGKFTARVAASCLDPDQTSIIGPESEREFLQDFPVELLHVGEDVIRRLKLLGINTLGQLAALPASAVLTQFGKEGRHLRRLAMGQDNRRVIPRRKKEVESSQQRAFDQPVDNLSILEAVTREMAEELVTRLQVSHHLCRELRVIIQFEDGTAQGEDAILSQPTFSREKITLNLRQLLRRIDYRCGVVSLEIVLGDMVPETGKQLDLFANRVEQETRLRRMMRDLTAKYSPDRFYRASLVDRHARLPERRFVLLEVDPQ